MGKYVVAHVSLFDNECQMFQVAAEDAKTALISILQKKEDEYIEKANKEELENCKGGVPEPLLLKSANLTELYKDSYIEEIIDLQFDADAIVNVLEVT